jgi:PAS domain S-box-containing protein
MIYGWRADEVIGQRMGVVVPFEFPGTTREAIVGQFRNDGLWQGETIQTCKDGTRLNIFSSVSFLRDENGSPVGIIAICRDITDRKRIEQAEHEQRALAEALRDTASLLTGTLNLDEVLDRILSHVVRAVPHDAATVMLVSDGTARVVRGQGMAARGLEEISTFHTPIISLPNYQHMYDTQLPLVVPDTHSSPHWMVLEERAWVHSFAGAPIRVDGQVIGFLNLYSSVPGFFKPECAGPLMVFADQAAVALKNAQLYNEIQAYAAELEARVEERTAQFRQAKEHVETILDSSSDVIILLNNEGLIRQVNPSFNDTFNCDPDHCIGQPLTTLVSPDSVAPVSAALRVAVEQHRPQRLAIEVCYNADIMFDADAALSPIVQANDQVSGVVCSLHDITMLKQTEASLRRMLTREMELGELKSRFIATTSHEFRTPLAIIQSSTDVLMRYADRLSVEQKEKEFQRIRSSIAGMVSLLDDILVISRAERGKLEFTPEPLNLENFCRDFLGVFETTSGRDHHLVFSYSGRAGEVLLDPKLLRHIVNNLISNAIKYSDPRSTVTFNVSCDNNRAILCVKDEGIGIPQADQARLFEPFYRAQNVDTIPGTGLGLAIVKQSVELHRGTIVVESRVGVGTTITVTLPAVQAVTASE